VVHTLFWLSLWLCGLLALGFFSVSLPLASIAILGGLLFTSLFSHFGIFTQLIIWLGVSSVLLVFNHPMLRKRFITHPLYKVLSANIPKISETEETALKAGTVGFEGELFTGRPNFDKLFSTPKPTLTPEEQAFLDGPVEKLLDMTNDWEITHEKADLPQTIWDYLKKEGFFALIISKNYGGKGFSALAHSAILAKIAGKSLTLASTVSVPNSLGPAELLLHYGTEDQKNYFLPRLAEGQEIPCFALTSTYAGSDAGSIIDSGVICKGMFNGEEIIGIKLNWQKRYITLAPIATILGLAFKLYDPDNLVGEKSYLGITCALIPTNLPGVEIGRRHFPINIPFQNGPTEGKDVFVPIDAIIGGLKMAGLGWKMLVECLSTGRAISLPSCAAGGARAALLATSAYSRIRRQFKFPLIDFEGIQQALATMAGLSYLSEATRIFTAQMVDLGEKPSVPSAISKYHVTEMGRTIACLAMDIHGGKGIMLGPKNYLARGYQGATIGITVEGANILTRNMIIFGQGAIRCHPFALDEMAAMQAQDETLFATLVNKHLAYSIRNASTSMLYGLGLAGVLSFPAHDKAKHHTQKLARASACFALISDVSMALLGGKLKFKEFLSARLGDMLSMMYMASAAIKRFEDQNQPQEDLPLLNWSVDYCLAHYWQALEEVLNNFPNKWVGRLLKLVVMPFGKNVKAPSDKLSKKVAYLFAEPTGTRSRLLQEMTLGEPFASLEKAFTKTVQSEGLYRKVWDAVKNDPILSQGSLEKAIEYAETLKIISNQESELLRQTERLCFEICSVDDFESHELAAQAPHVHKASHHKPSSHVGVST
jgi:acyl-CoA dehydrogenase